MKQPMKLTPTEFATVTWHWTVPVGQTLEDVLKPSYWQHVTQQLRPGHEVKIAAEDRTFTALLFVREVGKQEAFVSEIYCKDFDALSVPADEAETYVKWRSPASKFGVFRKTDNECLQDGFGDKVSAAQWAAQREVGAAA